MDLIAQPLSITSKIAKAASNKAAYSHTSKRKKHYSFFVPHLPQKSPFTALPQLEQ